MKKVKYSLLKLGFKLGLTKEQIRNADFRGADFRNAYFNGANFRGADFRNANFRNADFNGADFNGADFRNADFNGADFNGVSLNYKISETTFGLTLNCPEEGSFVGYKKAQGVIVTLLILEDSLRSSATTYKCRASKVKVLGIEGGLDMVSSNYDHNFIYTVGEVLEVQDFDTNRWDECSTGIHFFMSKQMARSYN